MLALSGLLLVALPQVAGAQSQKFSADHQYNAKFACGRGGGEESRAGVVEGHYNTIINVQALSNKTAIAYRATAVSSDLELEEGVPSDVSGRFDRDRDAGLGIVCNDIKRLFDVNGQQGFIEGFVVIYATNPLVVSSVITGQDETDSDLFGLSTLQVIDVETRNSSGSVEPQVFD
jgi:hypothetical protein